MPSFRKATTRLSQVRQQPRDATTRIHDSCYCVRVPVFLVRVQSPQTKKTKQIIHHLPLTLALQLGTVVHPTSKFKVRVMNERLTDYLPQSVCVRVK